MRITGIEVGDMWSFGEQHLVLNGFDQHSILIGKNNVGKSKVLAAFRWAVASSLKVAQPKPDHVALTPEVIHDRGSQDQAARPFLQINVTLDGAERAEIVSGLLARFAKDPVMQGLSEHTTNTSRLTFKGNNDGKSVAPDWEIVGASPINPHTLRGQPPQQLSIEQVQANWTGGALAHFKQTIAAHLQQKLKYVSGWRSLRDQVDGGTIVQNLHKWKTPATGERSLRRRFDAVQSVLRELMLTADVEIEPEHTGSQLHLTSNGRYVAIDACGDGIQHLLMIAYYLATAPDSILLIEEPETHLHPGLQRNLMSVLRKKLTGQSIVTTHSAAILDAGLASCVFRIEHTGKCTSGARCQTSADLYKVLDDLDVRASDLLQANLVIWVEGPTDRMFIKKCLELRGEKFEEGIHYQFAYYGGRLRSHVSFDEVAPELVNLLRLSRNVIMICDSDAARDGQQLDGPKQRLKGECEGAGGMYWVTAGREIENYIPNTVLSKAFGELLSNPSFAITLSRYDDIAEVVKAAVPDPPPGQKWKADYERNKVRLMTEILKHLTSADLVQYDLATRLSEVVEHIRKANP